MSDRLPTPHSARPSPLQYTMRLPVPVADLDPYGNLKATAQIRLMQLAASRASAAAGFDDRWYARNGFTWVVRYTHLELVEQARHGEELDIRTWVSDIRRVRSWRHYEITEAEGGAVLTRARTDWVFVDATTNGPAAIPDEVQKGLMPDGVAIEPRPKRIRFPDGADRPAIALRLVEWADLDSLGHVNNSSYAALAEQALLDHLARSGWTPTLDPAVDHLRIRTLEIEYLTPALYREALSYRVAFEIASDSELRAVIEIRAGEQAAARALGVWQWSRGSLPPAIIDAARRS